MFKKLFVSHCSADHRLVEKLTTLLEKTLDVPSLTNHEKAIRCSSIDEYKFAFGTSPKDKIPEEIKESYFICLLTPRSLQSTWVMFELGAAWGLDRTVVPLLFDLDFDNLPAALKNILAVKINMKNDIYGLIDQIARELNWNKKGSERINHAVEDFMRDISMTSGFDHTVLFRSDVKEKLPFEKIVAKTKKHLFVWAWSGAAAMNPRTRNLYIDLIKNGVFLKFMILNPETYANASQIMDMHQICAWPNSSVKKDISDGRANLIDFRNSLKPDQKHYLILKETSWLMTWSGIAIDPDLENGIIQIENYLYNYSKEFSNEIPVSNHLDYRPNILIDKSSKFFDPYYFSFKNMWEKAAVIE